MAAGVSLHVGFDSEATGIGESDFHNDAIALQDFAESRGFKPVAESPLLGKQATPGNVLKAIDKAIKSLDAGGLLLLTFACHGKGWNYGEQEMLKLAGHGLTDNELADRLRQLEAGHRAVIVVDACWSSGIGSKFYSVLARMGVDVDKRFGAVPRAHQSSDIKHLWASYSRYSSTYSRLIDPKRRQEFKANIWELAAADKKKITKRGVQYKGKLHGSFTAQLLCTFLHSPVLESYRELEAILQVGQGTCACKNPNSRLMIYGPDDTADEAPLTP